MKDYETHESKRWDEQKAATIAAAMQQVGVLDKALQSRDTAQRSRANMALYRRDWGDGFGEADTVQYGEDVVAAYEEYFPEDSRREAGQDAQTLEWRINHAITPMANLYDRDPTAAANMPTEDFAAAAQTD